MTAFDARATADRLAAESTRWDISDVVAADDGDIPVVDVGPWFETGDADALEDAASVLRTALEEVGFHQLVGHGVPAELTDGILDLTRRFHALPLPVKRTVVIDQPGFPIPSVGYMPIGTRKLPTRERGNPNEAFLVKRDRGIGFDDNRWPADEVLPGFRAGVEEYATTMERLALRLLPVFARALDLDRDWFAPAFEQPFWRLRMTHYPGALVDDAELGDVGIPPHVDTTFLTLLLAGGPGLTIYSRRRDRWILAPVERGAFIVNSGELLRQWSNDRVLSTRHFADNPTPESRYAVPFFFNATADFPMACLPSCHGPGNPPRYPTISYLGSQGVAQGE
ncbi:MAG: 2-oxoglutarate and iron-dependent oxygenase domain-containing protein [Actinomycetota bacterium]